MNLMYWFFISLGVAGIATIIYSAFKSIVSFLKFAAALAGGYVAYDMIFTNNIAWYIAIPAVGILIGIITIPFELVDQINVMQQKLDLLEKKELPQAEIVIEEAKK